MSRLSDAFADEPALVAYLTAGDPDAPGSAEYVQALIDGGADIIELGLPFSEPIADGPTIQAAISRSLAGGMTPDRYFELVADLDTTTPIVCFTYYNLIFRYDGSDFEAESDHDPVKPFVEAAAAAGIDGLIVPDLPVEESEPLREACDRNDIDLVFIVAPTTTDDRLRRLISASSGFVYVQARMGTTGAEANVSDATFQSLSRLPPTDLPRAVGFGVSSGDQARDIVEAGADGVVAGSVFVDAIAAGDTQEGSVTDRLTEIAADLKHGAVSGQRSTGGKQS